MKKFLFLSVVSSALLISCGGKNITYTPEESAEMCTYSKNVCKEATEFQMEYSQMPKEQQDALVDALNSYTEQCNRARKMCKDSKK